jgi:hypothetical protein
VSLTTPWNGGRRIGSLVRSIVEDENVIHPVGMMPPGRRRGTIGLGVQMTEGADE